MRAFEDYATSMAEMLRVPLPQGEPDPNWDVFSDWGIDSLECFELILLTETMAGTMVPPEAIPLIFTLADAYNYYRECALLGEGDDA